MSGQQWQWSAERLVERIVLRLSQRQRLRLLETAERLGEAEMAVARRALMVGLPLIDRSDAEARTELAANSRSPNRL